MLDTEIAGVLIAGALARGVETNPQRVNRLLHDPHLIALGLGHVMHHAKPADQHVAEGFGILLIAVGLVGEVFRALAQRIRDARIAHFPREILRLLAVLDLSARHRVDGRSREVEHHRNAAVVLNPQHLVFGPLAAGGEVEVEPRFLLPTAPTQDERLFPALELLLQVLALKIGRNAGLDDRIGGSFVAHVSSPLCEGPR